MLIRKKLRIISNGMNLFLSVVVWLAAQSSVWSASHDHMMMDEKGMIMNANHDSLPRDCQKVSKDVNITIRAGHQHAEKFPGKMFAFDNQQWDVAGLRAGKYYLYQ